MLTFLYIEQPNAPQHEMLQEDEKTGLPIKRSRKEQHIKKDAKDAVKKRTAKPQTGKRTGRKPKPRQARGVTL